MRFRIIPVAALSMLANLALAQNETDVLRYSQTYMKGSARFTAMGGAFGALGGDISSFMVNPAGVGVYRSSEFIFSTGIFNANMKTDFRGTSSFDNHTSVNIGNTGIVLPLYINSTTPVRSFNIGVAYNRVNDYNLNGRLTGFNDQSSMLDFFSEWTKGLKQSDLDGKYTNLAINDWRSKLAWMNYLLEPVNKDDPNNSVYYIPLNKGDKVFQDQWTNVRGFNDLINITFGGNVMDVAYFGGSFNITNINFHSVNTMSESAETNNTSKFNFFNYDQIYNAYGTGYSLSLGAILKPIQELRIGVSYQSPTWTFIDDDYSAYMNSNFNTKGDETPISAYSYRINSPQRVTASIAAVLGKFAIISADVDWVDYNTMKLRLKNDRSKYESDVNNAIGTDFKSVFNFRVGTEIKLNNNFALRGGYQYYGNPYKDKIVTDHPYNFYALGIGYNNTADKGISKPTNVYSAGLGYRTRSFFLDFAYSLTQLKSSYSLYDFYDPKANPVVNIYSGTAVQRINKNAYILTIGFKF